MEDIWRSPNLIYRAPEASDAAFYQLILSHSESYQTGVSLLARPSSMEDAKALAARLTAGLLCVIICIPAPEKDKTDPVSVGFITLRVEAELSHHRHAKLGIMLLEQHQGKGYGGEAIRWVLGWAFRAANLHRVELHVCSWNPRAIALYERLGFVHESRKREHYWYNGGYHDELCMSMLEREWHARYGSEAASPSLVQTDSSLRSVISNGT